jgi:hypothetical protein
VTWVLIALGWLAAAAGVLGLCRAAASGERAMARALEDTASGVSGGRFPLSAALVPGLPASAVPA